MHGKHITIQPPPESGSIYFNYKGSHSIVLLTLVNANYEFLYVDVGKNARASDGGVWANSTLLSHINDGRSDKPGPTPPRNSNIELPYTIVADDAFPLQVFLLMKHYPSRNQTPQQRIFNYRLSRARRVVENTLGIMAQKFRIFLTTITLSPEKVQSITLACVCLHNYLRKYSTADQRSFDEENLLEGSIHAGSWRDNQQMIHTSANNTSTDYQKC